MLAVIIFSLATLPIAILQLGLIIGLPWGKLAMGGKFGDVFEPKMRVSAAMQLLIILAALLIVLIRSGVLLENLYGISQMAIWAVVALYFVSSILNLITSSKAERLLGAPSAIVLFISSLYLALS